MSAYISARTRAMDTWRAIQGKPSTMTFTRPKVVHKDGTVTPPVTVSQVVRVEYDNRPSIAQGEAGVAPVLQAVIFGVRGHPSVADTDLEEGYEFDADGNHFRVTDVILVPGGVQGIARVNS